MRERAIPSSFLSTLSTAPEQPPQVMVTLKVYLCSAIFQVLCCSFVRFVSQGCVAVAEQKERAEVGDL